MEHGRTPPVTVTITGTSAALIVRLAEVTGDDGGALLMRSLGLLDLALKYKLLEKATLARDLYWVAPV